MSSIYRGTGWGKTRVGECDNGRIYSGTGWGRTCVGEYERGSIYSGTGWGRTCIGEYENGCIYRGTGWGRTCIGSTSEARCTRVPAGAAEASGNTTTRARGRGLPPALLSGELLRFYC